MKCTQLPCVTYGLLIKNFSFFVALLKDMDSSMTGPSFYVVLCCFV